MFFVICTCACVRLFSPWYLAWLMIMSFPQLCRWCRRYNSQWWQSGRQSGGMKWSYMVTILGTFSAEILWRWLTLYLVAGTICRADTDTKWWILPSSSPVKHFSRITTFPLCVFTIKLWSLHTPGRSEYLSPRLSRQVRTCCPSSMKVVELMNSEHILLVGTSNHWKEMIWGKLGVSCYHETDMDMVDLSRTHHFHGTGEQVLILVSACGIVEEDGKSINPWMIMELIPVVSQEWKSMVSVLGPMHSSNRYTNELLLEWSVTPKILWETFWR